MELRTYMHCTRERNCTGGCGPQSTPLWCAHVLAWCVPCLSLHISSHRVTVQLLSVQYSLCGMHAFCIIIHCRSSTTYCMHIDRRSGTSYVVLAATEQSAVPYTNCKLEAARRGVTVSIMHALILRIGSMSEDLCANSKQQQAISMRTIKIKYSL